MATSVQRVGGARTARYRQRQALRGEKRVELIVPSADVELIRRLATQLRAGGARAARLRAQIGSMLGPDPAQTGDELVGFFRRSPLVGHDPSFERDRSPGGDVDL